MALGTKINRRLKANNDTGLGTQTGSVGGRFLNKDGSFNVRKQGLSYWKRISFYSHLLELSWLQFLGIILACYLLMNAIFTVGYLLIGTEQLQGFYSATGWGRVREVYYFSAQTFTTVGYGRINPTAHGADLLATIQMMSGWLFFALVTGLLYGRFTRPKAFIAFSRQAVISPFQNGTAFMFRMVPYKTLHNLTDVHVVVNVSLQVNENGKGEYRFFSLPLERSRIDMFNLNWTIVHPVTEESPLLHFREEDLAASDAEVMVQVTGFDPVFSATVTARTSYTYREVVWGAKFLPMYFEADGDTTTVLDLSKLDLFEKVKLPEAVPVS